MANFKSYAYDKQTGQWVPVGVPEESIPTHLTDLLGDETTIGYTSASNNTITAVRIA